MTFQRRDVLKGLALTGISGAFSSVGTKWILAAENRHGVTAPDAKSISFLVAASSQREEFIAGAAHALGAQPSVIRLNGDLHDDISQAERQLHSRQPLIALVRPADGVLLRELTRGSGLRISFAGQHSLGGSDWPHRHHFITLPQSAGLGSSVLAGFANQSYVVTESPMVESAIKFRPVPGFASFRVDAEKSLHLHLADTTAAEGCAALGISGASVEQLAASSGTPETSSRSWAELLGGALVQVARGSWRSSARGPEAFIARGRGSAVQPESLVSIVIQDDARLIRG